MSGLVVVRSGKGARDRSALPAETGRQPLRDIHVSRFVEPLAVRRLGPVEARPGSVEDHR